MPPVLARQLADIVGSAHCLTGADRSPYVVEGRTPAAVVFPGTVDEVTRVVRTAAEASLPIIPWGGGTQMHLGHPPRDGALVLVTRRLDRVVEHEPGDLTATAEAGITLTALRDALGARGQWLPLDPPRPDRATLGGVLAANAAGPRRHLYGTARDLVIGLRVVGPDGALVRSGGKVVKNVAGYDLIKLYVGALGTLGVIVEITLKLRPRPEADRGVWAAFPDVGGAARAALALMASELIAHSLEVLDAEAIAECPALHRWTRERPGAGLLVAFDGLAETVDWQCRDASARLGAAGAGAVAGLDDSATAECLAAVRDLRGGVEPTLAVATAAVPPAALAAYLTEAQAVAGIEGLALRTVAHAGHGLATLVLVTRTGTPRNGTAAARVLGGLREAARARGGHLRLDRAPLGVKEAMSVWDAPGASVPLMQAIKRELDPRGLMNPGRFVGGI